MADGMPGMPWKEALKRLKEFHQETSGPVGGDPSLARWKPATMQKELEGLEESLKAWETRDERRERSLEVMRQASPGYTNFTERLRKVMSLAREQSNQAGHSFISQEHILLGILLEGGSISAKILRDVYSVDLKKIRTQILDQMNLQDRQV